MSWMQNRSVEKSWIGNVVFFVSVCGQAKLCFYLAGMNMTYRVYLAFVGLISDAFIGLSRIFGFVYPKLRKKNWMCVLEVEKA